MAKKAHNQPAPRTSNVSPTDVLAWLRQAAETMQSGVTIADLDGKIIYTNPAEAHMHGYTVDELLGKNARLLAPGGQQQSLSRADLNKLSTWRRETTNIRKDGTSFPVQLISNVVRNDAGDPIGIVTICDDLTQQKQTESALEQSESRLRELTRNIPGVVYQFMLDKNGTYSFPYVSEGTRQLLGVEPEEIRKNPRIPFDRIVPEDRRGLFTAVTKSGKRNSILVHEFRITDSTGEVRWMQACATPSRREDGSILWNTVLTDITTQKSTEQELQNARQKLEERVHARTHELARANTELLNQLNETTRTQQALRDSEARYRALFETASDAIVLLSNEGMVGSNEAAVRLFGFKDREALLGAHPGGDLSPPQQANGETSAQAASDRINQALRDGFARFEWLHKKKDGRTFPAEVTLSVLHYGDRPVVQGVVRDLTLVRRHERILSGVAGATNRLLTNPDFNDALQEVARILGEATEMDRVYVFERHKHPKTGEDLVSQRIEWCSQGTEPQIDNPLLQNISHKTFETSDWYHQMLEGKPVGGLTREFSQPMRQLQEMQGVKAMLLVPIPVGNDYWGFIGFDDCHEEHQWTTSEKSLLGAMAASIGAALDRKRGEEALRYRIEFETLITTLSTRFVNLPSAQINEEIDNTLQAIGRFASVDRAYVFLFSDDGKLMSNTHEWCAAGITSEMHMIQDLPVGSLPWFHEQISKPGVVHVSRVADLPADAGPEKEEWERQQIQSLLCVPMLTGDSLVGFIGFDSVRVQKEWPEEIISLLRIVGEILANAVGRLRAEEALRASEERWRSVIENAPVIIMTIGRDSRILSINRTVPGLTPEQVIGTSAYDYIDEKNTPFLKEVLERVFTTGKSESYEIEGLGPNGQQAWYETQIGAVQREGEVRTVIMCTQDITARKKATEERLTLERKLLETQKLESLGVLAGGIAHDFNNLLMAMLGNASLALMELPPESVVRPTVQRIETAARRAGELTNQLLAYSGKGRFMVGPINLNAVIEEMTHLLRVSISKRAIIRYSLSRELPSVEADPTQMRQIIMNLIVNASDAIGDNEGVITVNTGVTNADATYGKEVFLGEGLREGNYAYLEVTDTGCGMNRETQKRIFEPFFTTKFTGRGLGLAAVLGIVRGHGGALKVYSEPDQGTTFKILLPVSGAPAQPLSGTAKERNEWRSSGTVLIVDDEESVRTVTADMIRSLGLTPLLAGDGQAGLALFRAHFQEIRCVLLDMTMPVLPGPDAFRQMHQIAPQVPIILMSGYNEQDTISRFAGKGLAGFLQKPFTPTQLATQLEGALSKEQK